VSKENYDEMLERKVDQLVGREMKQPDFSELERLLGVELTGGL